MTPDLRDRTNASRSELYADLADFREYEREQWQALLPRVESAFAELDGLEWSWTTEWPDGVLPVTRGERVEQIQEDLRRLLAPVTPGDELTDWAALIRLVNNTYELFGRRG